MEAVRHTRTYNAEGRRERARANRENILRVARELFVERGYAGASVADIAGAAGVSAPTIFAQFGSKVRLLKEATETALVGDVEPEPLADRPEMVWVRAAPTSGAVLDRLAALITHVARRACPIALVVYGAADSDAQIAALAAELDAQRLRSAEMLADVVRSKPDYLAPADVDSDAARASLRDTIWTHNSPLQYRLLVVERGWSVAQYGEWVRVGLRVHSRIGAGPTDADQAGQPPWLLDH